MPAFATTWLHHCEHEDLGGFESVSFNSVSFLITRLPVLNFARVTPIRTFPRAKTTVATQIP